ncbi:hypothetical protein SDRG_05797 [Saprolegnia diclina VS20]|uniref:Uncharacterized protein n=1 Tax=Saprolegnia diclina (strain VS20) TaxID=1156394 RepID=T0QSM2_SAPDV|nr:hypothetical protein SDRG_05797 [Saprolegnia diclina VS20]EQC36975.1 hypothetical protein SDRG_05797 [Saprolegnia diclina VS20]|eukprot:XP_008609756.1 hypothetical protein SDRG_05797 [Saprolegnia diclina VS20]
MSRPRWNASTKPTPGSMLSQSSAARISSSTSRQNRHDLRLKDQQLHELQEKFDMLEARHTAQVAALATEHAASLFRVRTEAAEAQKTLEAAHRERLDAQVQRVAAQVSVLTLELASVRSTLDDATLASEARAFEALHALQNQLAEDRTEVEANKQLAEGKTGDDVARLERELADARAAVQAARVDATESANAMRRALEQITRLQSELAEADAAVQTARDAADAQALVAKRALDDSQLKGEALDRALAQNEQLQLDIAVALAATKVAQEDAKDKATLARRARDEIALLKQALTQAGAAAKEAQDQALATAEAAKRDTADEVQRAYTRIALLEADLAHAHTATEAANGTRATELQAAVEAMASEKVAFMQSKLALAERTMDDLTASQRRAADQVATKLNALNRQLAHDVAQQEAACDQIQALEAALAHAVAKTDALETQLGDATSDLIALRFDVHELRKARVAELSTAIETYDDAARTIQGVVDAAIDEVSHRGFCRPSKVHERKWVLHQALLVASKALSVTTVGLRQLH